MTLEELKAKARHEFTLVKRELKDWQYGTVYKDYDKEEEVETLADDVDRYFPDDYTDVLIDLTHQATIEECVRIAEGMKERCTECENREIHETPRNNLLTEYIATITRNSK